jgi:hypothetical protein
MNSSTYHLLRNNKEEGPFTAEEIIRKNLRPYDLIWIDGRSAAWSYPGELTEFKMYAPLPVEANQPQNKSFVSASIQAALAVNYSILGSGTQQKPRYKVSAAWNKIPATKVTAHKPPMVSEPERAALKNNISNVAGHSKSLSWEEAWLDWEHEKITTNQETGTKTVQPIINHSTKNSHSKTAPAPETKFEQPYPAIKEHYNENIPQPKNRFGKLAALMLPTVAMAIIFGIGYWLLHDNETNAKITIPAQPYHANTIAAKTAGVTSNSENLINTTEKNPNSKNSIAANFNDRAQERKPKEKTIINNHKSLIAEKENNTVVSKNSSEKIDPAASTKIPVTATNGIISDSSRQENIAGLNAGENNSVLHKVNQIEDAATAQATYATPAIVKKPVARKTVSDYVTTPEYITVKNGTANIKIQNVSDVNLDLVVIDVQYYDAAHNYRKGETMYLHNLKAGKNIVIKTPKDNDAYFATSKVSLISSDTGNVNVISEN